MINGRHEYVLIGIGNDQLCNEQGLEWYEIFEFLYSHYRPRYLISVSFLDTISHNGSNLYQNQKHINSSQKKELHQENILKFQCHILFNAETGSLISSVTNGFGSAPKCVIANMQRVNAHFKMIGCIFAILDLSFKRLSSPS